MKKYEKYKDSGVEWIGAIPIHWEILPFKRHMKICNGCDYKAVQVDYSETSYPVIGSGGPFAWAKSYLYEGEAVLLGRKGTIDKPLFVNNAFWTVDTMFYSVPNDGETSCKYMYYQALGFPFGLYATSTALPSMTQTDLGNNLICVPPLNEQKAIASYLDSKCSRIDEMISAKTKQMDSLKEYRTSLISEVVTKGLNPEAEMVNSGIESIGNSPKGWKIVRLKYLLDSPLQYGASETGEEDRPEYPRYIRITDITEENTLRENGVKYLAPQLAAPYMLKKGDILFARSGATVGKTFLFDSDVPSCFAGYLIKASCGEKLLPKYLFFYTRSKFYENWKNATFTQATIQNIGADKYNELPMLLPSITIQHEIVKFLDEKYSKIADILTSLEAEIQELKRYKTSIISEAVTGKVKVF